MEVPIRELEKLIVSKEVAHGRPRDRLDGGQPRRRPGYSPASPSSAKDESTKRLDGIVATIMAIGCAVASHPGTRMLPITTHLGFGGQVMTRQGSCVTLAGSAVKNRCHACAFFHETKEEYGLLLPFVQEGFQQGHKIFQIVEGRQRDERLRRIGSVGIDVAAAEQSGQLEVRPWENATLREGRFDQYAMLALIEEVLGEGKDRFGLTRFWANMEWSLEDFPGVDDIVEFECRVNEVTSRFEDIVVCTYDLNRFSATVVMDILRTHPQVIVGGILQENPFYVPPQQFLQELRTRSIPVQ
jgi:MEDS: MEthanogen/methylotroph, DcmR Sensory domain